MPQRRIVRGVGKEGTIPNLAVVDVNLTVPAHNCPRSLLLRACGAPATNRAKSKEEAIELTRRFLAVHGDEWDIECEVRQLDGPEFGREA
jgi:hypothetical protein